VQPCNRLDVYDIPVKVFQTWL